MTTTWFKQSENWNQSMNIDWFIEKAEFAFTNSGHKGNRVRIVTKEELNGMDCFEFDNDYDGIVIISETKFNDFWESIIEKKTTDVVTMLVGFLKEWGAGEFVNPKPGLIGLKQKKLGKLIQVNSVDKSTITIDKINNKIIIK